MLADYAYLEFGQDWLEGRNNNVHNLAFNGVAPGPFFHPLEPR